MYNAELEIRFRRVVASGHFELFERWLIYLSRAYGGLLGFSLLIKTDYFGQQTYSSILAYVATYAKHPLAARMVDRIISEGFPINFQDGNGDTALHYAVSANNHFVVSALLASPDIDPNIQGLNGLSPLMLAASCGDVCLPIARRLLAFGGIDLTLVDDNGEDAYRLANEAGGHRKIHALLCLYWQIGPGLFNLSVDEMLACESLLQRYLVEVGIAMRPDQVIDYLGDLLGLNILDEGLNTLRREESSESLESEVVPDIDSLGAARPSSTDHHVPDIDYQHNDGPRP